tara:strand:+ start:42 stop:317 length:276 start_codon:yes stop_codon:yes gene_type:complete
MGLHKKTLIKQKKVVLNKHNNKDIEVAIAEIYRCGNAVRFVLSFGVDSEVTILGRDEWEKFLDLIINLDWDPEDTWIRPLRKDKKHKCRFD